MFMISQEEVMGCLVLMLGIIPIFLIAEGSNIPNFTIVKNLGINPPNIKVLPNFFLFDVERQDKNLSCKASGKPAPVVKWYKDNKEISSLIVWENMLRLNQSSIIPRNTDLQGIYHCEATNIYGHTVSTKTKISNVTYFANQTILAKKGEPVVVPCPVKDYFKKFDMHRVRWSFRDLYGNRYYHEAYSFLPDGSAYLYPDTEIREAICDLPDANLKFYRTIIQISPAENEIPKKPTEWLVEDGKEYTIINHDSTDFFMCATTNVNSKVKVAYVDAMGKKFDRGEKFQILGKKIVFKPGFAELDGKFSCSAEDDPDLKEVQFKILPQISIKIDTPREMNMIYGRPFTYTCNATSSRLVIQKVLFFKNEKPFTGIGVKKYVMESNHRKFYIIELNISNVSTNDVAFYECRFTSFGVVRSRTFALGIPDYIPVIKIEKTEITSTSLKLYWELNDFNASRYRTKLVSNDFSIVTNLNRLGDGVTGLNPYTDYEFSIYFCAGQSCAKSKETIFIKTKEDTPTAFVNNLQHKIEYGNIIVSCSLPETGWNGIPSGVTGYLIDVETKSDIEVKRSNDCNVVFDRFESNRIYNYTVAIVNNEFEGPNVTIQQIRVGNLEPSIVQEVKVSASNNKLYIAFDPPEETNGEILYYQASTNSSDAKTGKSNAPRIIISELTENTGYEVFIVAVNRFGKSKNATALKRTTNIGKPAMPKNLVLSAEEEKSIFIEWEAGDGPGAENYVVEFKDESSRKKRSQSDDWQSTEEIKPFLPLHYRLTDITEDKLYKVRVKATNAYGSTTSKSSSINISSSKLEKASTGGSSLLVLLFVGVVLILVALLLFVWYRNRKHTYPVAKNERRYSPKDKPNYVRLTRPTHHDKPVVDRDFDDPAAFEGFKEDGSFIGAYSGKESVS